MQTIFGTILCILLKCLVHTRTTITFMPKIYSTSNNLQKGNVSMYPDLNFTQDISMSDKSDHHILNFKSDWNHSDNMTMRSEREVGEMPLANISITPEPIKSSLSKPTSLRAFVEFNNQFTKNDIFMTSRWKQPNFVAEAIQGYTVKCFFFENLQEIQICDDKNIITKLEHMVYNLKSNTTYYFRVRAHTKVVGLYTEISVSTMHENPIPKLLIQQFAHFEILDLDLYGITAFLFDGNITLESIAYSIQEHRIYWANGNDLMTSEIENKKGYFTKMASYNKALYNICIDWVARNLYFISYVKYQELKYIVKFDLTMWKYGIIKFDEIMETNFNAGNINVLPSMGIYILRYNWRNEQTYMIKYHLDRKNEQNVHINSSITYFCSFQLTKIDQYIIDDMNNEKPLIYWLNDT